MNEMPGSSPEVRRLVRMLQSQQARIESLERAVTRPQMGFSSIDDGTIVEKDAAGEVVARVGKQPDGTHGVVDYHGPIPPAPSAPAVEGGPGLLTVTWDGTLTNARPLDLARIEAYAAPTPFEHLEEADLLGSITGRDGGRLTVTRTPGTWHVALVAVSRAEKRSVLSALADVEVLEAGDSEAVERLAKAFHTDTRPPTPEDGEGRPEGAYWTMLDATGAEEARWRWVDGEWVDAPLSPDFIPEAYVDRLAANQGLIQQLLAHNVDVTGHLNVTGTFAAESDDFALTLAPQGVQLITKQTLAEDPADSWVVPGDLRAASDLTGTGGRLWTISGNYNPNGSPVQQNTLREWSTDGTMLAEEISGPVGTPRYSRIRAAGNYLLGLMYNASDGGAQSARLMDLDRNVISTFPFDPTDFGGDSATVSPAGHVVTLGFGGPFAPNSVRVYNSSGTLLHDWPLRLIDYSAAVPIAATESLVFVSNPETATIDTFTLDGDLVRTINAGSAARRLYVEGGVLFAGTQDGRVQGYDAASGTPRFSWRLPYPYVGFTPKHTFQDGSLFASATVTQGQTEFKIDRFGVGDLPVALASLSTVTGRLDAVGADLSGETRAETIRATLLAGKDGERLRMASPVVPGGINRFHNLTVADQEFGGSAQRGTRIITEDPLAEWVRVANPSGPGGQWVRVWSEDVGDSGVILLDQIDLSGPNNYNAGNVLTVPAALRGTFQKYVVTVAAGSSGYTGTTARPLCVWINSRLQEEYRNTTILSGGAEFVSAVNSTAYPRTGYIHAYNPGALEITFIPNNLGDVGLVSWTTSGWANAGAADGIVITGGGRWNGPTQTITEFRVGTNVNNEEWAGSSSAQLWGYR